MVLSPEETNYFSSSPLHQSHSQPKFISYQASYLESLAKSKNSGFNTIFSRTNPASSSAPSPPRTLHANSTAPLYTSTQAGQEDDKDQIVFPSYHDGQIEDLEPPASTSTNVSRPESPDLVEHAVDDTSVRTQPFRHVDYLSHRWKEEDIWASWKHIVSQRKAYDNSVRLENASWRTWTKLTNKLKTVSPESLNWLKDCDVTWLYGPLLIGSVRPLRTPPSSPVSSISKSNSFLNKKPILRKRSMSEIILQRSFSASLLLKQTSVAIRVLSSGLTSPDIGEKKRIHFNEHVKQCIALEMKGDNDEEPDSDAIHDSDDSDSDDGVVMMARTNTKWKSPLMSRRGATQQANFSGDGKTIAMLPSTTLKYGEYNPESLEVVREHEEDDAHMDQQPPSAFANHKDSIAVTREQFQNLHISKSFSSLNGDLPSKPLCMFISHEEDEDEDEDEVVSESLFEKVVDTVNAAKDIAYVIWNVG